MSDLTDTELELALNGECHTVEVVVWLAREVKRRREAQPAAAASTHEDVRGVALRALDRHLVGTAALGVVMRNRIAEAVADEVGGLVQSAQSNGPAPVHTAVRPDSAEQLKDQELPEIFPFVTPLHREVVLRPRGGKLQDIEMTPDEANCVAHVLRTVGACNVIQLSGNAPLEIFALPCGIVLRHKDGEAPDLKFTPAEAVRIADQLCVSAAASRAAVVET